MSHPDDRSGNLPSPSDKKTLQDELREVMADKSLTDDERIVRLCCHGWSGNMLALLAAPSHVEPCSIEGMIASERKASAPSSIAAPAERLKLWYHRGIAHGLTVEEVDAVFDAALSARMLTQEQCQTISSAALHLATWATSPNKEPYANTLDLAKRLDAMVAAERGAD